jgi:hypothetical protein
MNTHKNAPLTPKGREPLQSADISTSSQLSRLWARRRILAWHDTNVAAKEVA